MFLRSLFAKRMKDSGALEEQREPGWKLFGKVPHNELSTKDSRKIQKVRSHTCTHTRSVKKSKCNGPDFWVFFMEKGYTKIVNIYFLYSVYFIMHIEYCPTHLNGPHKCDVGSSLTRKVLWCADFKLKAEIHIRFAQVFALMCFWWYQSQIWTVCRFWTVVQSVLYVWAQTLMSRLSISNLLDTFSQFKKTLFLFVMCLFGVKMCRETLSSHDCLHFCFSAVRNHFNSEIFTFKDLFIYVLDLLILIHYAWTNQMQSYDIVVNGALFPVYRLALGNLNPLIQPLRVHLDFTHIQVLPLSLAFVLCRCNWILGYWVTGLELLDYLGSVAVAYRKRWVRLS